MSATLQIVREIQVLNDDRPLWASHAVVYLIPTDGDDAETTCDAAIVAWCASAEEAERTSLALAEMAASLPDEPTSMVCQDFETTRYILAVQSAADDSDEFWGTPVIVTEPLGG